MAAFSGIRVLYLEDDALFAATMQRIMLSLSMHVVHLRSPLGAFDILKQENFDIILSDVKMPESNGVSFAEKVREDNADIPIILMSNYQEVEDLHRAIPLRLVDYLVKPISLDKLLESFAKALMHVQKKDKDIHIHDDIFYKPSSKTILYTNSASSVPLGQKEWMLLELLLQNRNHFVTIQTIENVIYDGRLNENSLRNTVLRLREKIKNKTLIKNYRELGYMLK